MDLRCIFWNTRNIGYLGRPGERGNGVPLFFRLKQIAAFVNSWRPDILFLLETGDNIYTDNLRKRLDESLIDRQSFRTAKNNDGETYMLVIRKDLLKFCVSFGLYGKDFVGHRRPARLCINLCNRKICFLVYHATFKTDPEVRLRRIKEYATECLNDNDHKGHSIVLCGDLNVNEDGYKGLEQSLHPLGLKHEGPFYPESKKPAATSLVKFKTLLLNMKDTQNQPYDQVWFKPVHAESARIINCRTFMPSMNLPIIWSSIPDRIVDNLEAFLERQLDPQYNLRPRSPSQQIIDEIQAAINIYLGHKKELDNLSRLPKETWKLLPPKMHTIMEYAQKAIKKLDPYLKRFETQPKPTHHQYERALIVLAGEKGRNGEKDEVGVIESFAMAAQVISCYVSGKAGLQLSEASTFAFAMSDHLPVEFRINLA